MSISICTMGKFTPKPIIERGGGGIMNYEKAKPFIRITKVKYDDREDIRVIVTSVSEDGI